jgi:hypothetical protein
MRVLSSSERLDCIEQNLKPLHGDVPIDVLKVDIEDGEWQVLPQIIHWTRSSRSQLKFITL